MKSLSLSLIVALSFLDSLFAASSYHDVIVIGSGMAGMTAANALMKTKKYTVLVLESANRIGGRTYTDSSIGNIDMGASKNI